MKRRHAGKTRVYYEMREPKVKNLLKYLREYRLESFLGPLFKMLEATFELFIPLVVAKIIDVGI